MHKDQKLQFRWKLITAPFESATDRARINQQDEDMAESAGNQQDDYMNGIFHRKPTIKIQNSIGQIASCEDP